MSKPRFMVGDCVCRRYPRSLAGCGFVFGVMRAEIAQQTLLRVWRPDRPSWASIHSPWRDTETWYSGTGIVSRVRCPSGAREAFATRLQRDYETWRRGFGSDAILRELEQKLVELDLAMERGRR